jgi:hypothetical protein
MDRPYIKTVVESYLIDNDIDDDKFEELNNHIVESMEYMKGNYECGYVTIHEMSSVQQQRYIYNVLDLELSEEEGLTGMEIAGISLIVPLLVILVMDKFGHKLLKKATTGFIAAWIKIHKLFEHEEWFKEHKVLSRILDSNFSDCKRKAGFTGNESPIDLRILLKPRPIRIPKLDFNGIQPDVNVADVEKGEGLRDCYLDYMVSAIASISIIYVKCIEESGESQQQVSTDFGMGALLNYPTGEGCQVLYDELTELHKHYNEALDVFFKDDKREKQNWLNRLDQKVRGAKRGEHLRPSTPRREKSGFNKSGKYEPQRKKRFTGNTNVDPTAPMNRR